MAVVTVIKATQLTGKSAPTIYRHLKQGKLSKTDSGIDTTELIRVYGELRNIEKPNQEVKSDISTDIDFIKDELMFIKGELSKSQDVNKRLLDIIEHRLPAPTQPSTIQPISQMLSKLFS
jgi:hypothetical protein